MSQIGTSSHFLEQMKASTALHARHEAKVFGISPVGQPSLLFQARSLVHTLCLGLRFEPASRSRNKSSKKGLLRTRLLASIISLTRLSRAMHEVWDALVFPVYVSLCNIALLQVETWTWQRRVSSREEPQFPMKPGLSYRCIIKDFDEGEDAGHICVA